jgi:hypothetical protein
MSVAHLPPNLNWSYDLRGNVILCMYMRVRNCTSRCGKTHLPSRSVAISLDFMLIYYRHRSTALLRSESHHIALDKGEKQFVLVLS